MANCILECLWTIDCYVLSIFLFLNGSNYCSYSITVSLFYTGWLWGGGVTFSPDWEEMCLRSFIHISTWCGSWDARVAHDAIIEKDFGDLGRGVWCSFHIGWMWIVVARGKRDVVSKIATINSSSPVHIYYSTYSVVISRLNLWFTLKNTMHQKLWSREFSGISVVRISCIHWQEIQSLVEELIPLKSHIMAKEKKKRKREIMV